MTAVMVAPGDLLLERDWSGRAVAVYLALWSVEFTAATDSIGIMFNSSERKCAGNFHSTLIRKTDSDLEVISSCR